jgi:hypothetical protein
MSFTNASREIASHHFAAETLRAASFGPDIQLHGVWRRISVAFLFVASGGPKHPLIPRFFARNFFPSHLLGK